MRYNARPGTIAFLLTLTVLIGISSLLSPFSFDWRDSPRTYRLAARVDPLSSTLPENYGNALQRLRQDLAKMPNKNSKRVFLKTALARKPAPYFLAGCAKISMRAELPYIIEWLEYHRLAGFDKLVLYLDDVAEQLSNVPFWNYREEYRLLQSYYSNVLKDPDFIELRFTSTLLFDAAADFTSPSKYPHEPTHTHRITQQTLIKHCYTYLAPKAEWVSHFDVDEFWVVNRTDSSNPPLRDYLRGLYSDNSKMGHLYALNSLSSVYGSSFNFGLGTAKNLFAQRQTVTRNPYDGTILFLSANNVLAFDPAVELENTQEEKLRNLQTLQDILVHSKKAGASARNVFADLAQNSKSVHLRDEHRSILETCTMSVPSVRFGVGQDELLNIHARLRPECEPTLKLFKTKASREALKSSSPTAISQIAKNATWHCRPGTLHPKITSMGKSIYWTGNRYEVPEAYQNWLVNTIIEDEMHLHSLRGSRNLPSPKTDIYTAPFQHIFTISGVLLSTELYLKYQQDNQLNAMRGRRHRRNSGWANRKKVPPYCMIPWVHGCGHTTLAAQILAPAELRVQHYMMRSLESRTIRDARWRRGSSGWGKFEGPDVENEFSIIPYTNAVDHPKLSIVPRLKQSIALRFNQFTVFKPTNITHALLDRKTDFWLPSEWQRKHVCEPCPPARSVAVDPHLCAAPPPSKAPSIILDHAICARARDFLL